MPRRFTGIDVALCPIAHADVFVTANHKQRLVKRAMTSGGVWHHRRIQNIEKRGSD